jgi:hypothetical protein
MATIPSIAMIPSGVKASKLYSVLPTDGTGDFTTTRASVARRVNESRLIEEVAANVPRLDYSDGGCPSLLLEGTATNLVLTSDSGNYGSAPASETLTISPDGTNNAVIPTPSSNSNRYQQDVTGGTFATNTLLTYSWYRKRITTPVITSFVGDLKSVSNVNLTISEVATQIESDINGFDRFQVVVQITDGALASTFRAYFGEIVGVGNSSIAYFGHQLEENSYATSLIKTVGTTQTRVADTASGSGSSTVINSSEGVLYFEGSALANDLTNRFIIINDGTDNNRLTFRYLTTSNKLSMEIHIGGILKVAIEATIADITVTQKVGLKYKQNDYSLWVNGVEVGVNTLAEIWSANTLNNIDLLGFGQAFYGKVKSLQVYTTALSDSELAILTTI